LDDEKIFFYGALEELNNVRFLLENEKYNLAISRSYYAVFYATKSLLAKKGFFPKTHQGVIKKFSLEYVKNDDFDYEAFVLLSKLEENRRESDYDLVINFEEEEAQKAFENAEKFIDECRRFI
jgi:uncharacterized protein (UPF0332 family)